MQQIKTYRYKLRPTAAQETTLRQWLGACRYAYNLSLDYKKTLWQQYKININKNDLQKELTAVTKDVDWLGQVHSQTLQDVTDRLFLAYEGFYSGKGFPRFAKKGQYQSIGFKQSVKATVDNIKLPKLGKVRYYNSQPCEGVIKQAVVRQRPDGWYVSLVVETDIQPLPASPNSIGIDMGIKSLLVTSEGESVENPKHLYKAERRLKRLQRSVSRKKKGSSNRKKAVAKLARQHQTVANTRRDFHHKLTTRLIRENQAISIEELRIQNMMANHTLAKSIGDAGWYQLTQLLEYKARWYGRTFTRVNARHTSQDCSACGQRNTELTLQVRSWVCAGCGAEHDRDVNAAINIKARAVGHTVTAFETYAPTRVVAEESPQG